MTVGVGEIGRLLRLKTRRLETAQAAHAAAVAAVHAAEAALVRRDAAIAALDGLQKGLDAWFAAPPPEPRMIEIALARRDALSAQRRDEITARENEVAGLEDAQAHRAETAQAVARAQARRDAAERILERLRSALLHRREALQELEFEERLAGAGGLA